MLTGSEIARQVEEGNICIRPFDPGKLNPNSYNLVLDDTLKVYAAYAKTLESYERVSEPDVCYYALDVRRLEKTIDVVIDEDKGLTLYPGILYLGCTKEFTSTDKFIPVIEGRSSVARLGMQVHMTAGFGDIGFAGQWTLEITVVHPLTIYRNMAVCQIAYTRPDGAVIPYSGRYQHQAGATPSAMWRGDSNG